MKLVSGAIVFLLALNAYPQDEKALQLALKKFDDDYYRMNAGDDEKVGAVRALAAHRHEKVAKTLGPLLTRASVPVRIIVARELGRFQGIEAAAQTLLSALRAHENEGKKTTAVRIETLRSLGSLNARQAASEIERLIGEKDVWLAKAAIDAAGKIRVKTLVEPLIRALRRIEGADGSLEIMPDPFEEFIPTDLPRLTKGAAALRPERPKLERDLLKDPILGALRSITRQACTLAKDWEAWWRKNKSTFAVPE